MNKPVTMCLAGKRPSQCGWTCSQCYSHDVIYIDFCDQCGAELLEDKDLESGLCEDCMKKIEFKEESECMKTKT